MTMELHKTATVDLSAAAYVAPSAQAYGSVILGEASSLWHNVVIRSEHQHVEIGRFTNVQDMAMIHVGRRSPTIVGDYCSITHHVTLHGCTIGDFCLIGINSTIMDGCVIGAGSVISGHCFLAEGTIIPPNSIVMGVPGKVVRERDSHVANAANALLYHRNALATAKGNHRGWCDVDPAQLGAEAAGLIHDHG